jgi:hypothetical protein
MAGASREFFKRQESTGKCIVQNKEYSMQETEEVKESCTQEGVRELIIRRRVGDNYYLDYSTVHDCLTKF